MYIHTCKDASRYVHMELIPQSFPLFHASTVSLKVALGRFPNSVDDGISRDQSSPPRSKAIHACVPNIGQGWVALIICCLQIPHPKQLHVPSGDADPLRACELLVNMSDVNVIHANIRSSKPASLKAFCCSVHIAGRGMEALAAIYLILLSGCAVVARLVPGMYDMLVLRLRTAQSAKLRIPEGRKWHIPWLGETLDLLLSDVDDFLSRHTQKYGETFSTHVFGGPAVVTTTMDASAFCLSTPQAHHALRAIYSNEILGRDSLSMIPAGARHTALRKLLQHQLLAPEAMRGFCSAVSQTALSCMKPWGEKVVMEDEATKFAFRVVLRFTCGSDYYSYSHEQVEKLLHLFADMENGLMSLPLNIPFMGRRRALNARKKVDLFAHKLIEARQRQGLDHTPANELDGLSSLMEAQVVEGYEAEARKLRSGEVLDNLLLLLGAGHRAPGIFLTWVVKLLADHPDVLEQVQAEQDAIAREMKLAGRKYVTWEDTKKMQLTWRVIQETMRITTPAAFVMRKARRDLEFQGMLIPRGWRVLVFWRSVHLNPEVHPNPKVFDPSRFEKPIAAPSFSPFGMGPRGCPGSEFAKQEMLVFLHHLVTTYTWKPVNPNEKIKQWPIACFNKGLPITLTRRCA